MDVEICVDQNENEKVEGKLLVFNDVEYRIYPCFAVKFKRRLVRVVTACDWQSETNIGRPILQNLCGALRPGRLTFILGPSGAGKTTLLQILAGRKREGVSGQVFGGQGSVLVNQHANLLPAFTANEVLFFAANLKLPLVDYNEKRSAVRRVAMQLGIEAIMDTRTPQLSGGERKRLSVACELLTDPPILLLDEPTSGLDSVSSLSVIRALSAVARSGPTVACVVHQPSSRLYSMTDDLILLSEGRTLYAGPRSEVPNVLQRAGYECPSFYNPADYLLEVATGEHSGDFNLLESEARLYSCEIQKIMNGQLLHRRAADLSNGDCNGRHKTQDIDHDNIYPLLEPSNKYKQTYAAGAGGQLRALLWRCGVSGLRDVHLTQLRLGAHLLVALLLGALYAGAGDDAARYGTNTSCLFFFLLFLFFSNAMPTIHTFPAEAEIVIEEHLNYWYSLPVYWISKILADIPAQLICATVFTIPAWYLTGQPDECWRLLLMWLLCAVLTILAQTMGLAVGAACDVKAGLFLVPACNMPMLLFSGYFIPYNEIPFYLKPFAWISYFRYAFDAALQCVYGFDRKLMHCSEEICAQPKTFLARLSVPKDYWGSLSVMFAWIVVLQALLMFILYMRVKLACK